MMVKKMISINEIKKAYNRISDVINKTPVFTSSTLNAIYNAKFFLKCENFQKAGAFKFRGAYNALKLLPKEAKEKGIIAHSSGNHAQAVALAAKLLHIKTTIVMSKDTPPVKIRATQDTYGATVVLCEPSYEERLKMALDLKEKHSYTLIHPFDDDNIIAGAGTVAFEFVNQIENLDVIFAPIGGGGLLSGTLIAVKEYDPKIKVYGVEPENADDAARSIMANSIVCDFKKKSVADGLLASISERTFRIINRLVDGIITVSDEEIFNSMQFLWERMKLVVEPSGACSLAGALSKKISVSKKQIGVIISGGNVDLSQFFNNLKQNI